MAHRASGTVEINAPLARVLEVACTQADMLAWFPLPLEVTDGPDRERLKAGDVVRAQGRLAGKTIRSEITLVHADADGYLISARGPLNFRVSAELTALDATRTRVDARIEVSSGGGLGGRLMYATAGPLVSPGLGMALRSLARIAEQGA